ncbi:MAG: bifunctional isocitrate dehydrogenase kinase/phosphatase [Bacteroidetes bacterium]|nr:bifunctional isocitrate dehydrogenase kinase/phosphatase [Bacteroidota bacterium]
MSTNNTAELAAQIVLEAFEAFDAAFRSITRRAKHRFEQRDWQGGRHDAIERLDSYERSLDQVVRKLDTSIGSQARETPLWVDAKPRFAALLARRYDIGRGETYFNSVTRRMLRTVGLNRDVEFFYLHPKPHAPYAVESVYKSYSRSLDTESLIRLILDDCSFGVGFEDLDRDVGLVAQEIDLHLWPVIGAENSFSIDVVKAIFYRNKEAYIVGRINASDKSFPLIIPLVNGESGIHVDTVLLEKAEAGIVFSFAYSYFFVDIERYDALIQFLRSIIPQSQTSELYISLGYNHHGKTGFYRDLHRYVHVSKEQFVIAPGLEGAVMNVFTLPNYGFVFKVIKDRPCFLRSNNQTSKVITQERVRYQYGFVSHRDPAGRMVNTQEFENLRFKKKRFTSQVLEEFQQAVTRNVTILEDYVIIKHVYVQRKVVPLPLYFRNEKNPEAIRHVLIDFGYFLKDLAASGVFPSDLFNTWNYGVTQWGRVVLYDYDDVLPIERIRFREKPQPRDELQESEPEENRILATEDDFFMDEIERYSGIPHPLRGVFKSVHGDLYTLDFWKNLTGKLCKGEIFDVIPYDRAKRFRGE